MQQAHRLILSVVIVFGGSLSAHGQTFLAVDQDAWPGKIVSFSRAGGESLYWQRGPAINDHVVPKIQSLTTLRDGTIAFCSGLDRSVQTIDRAGREYELHYGGSLVRQLRTDTNGDLFWSGLETPIDRNPLPDGFILCRRSGTGTVETLLTFSQGLVGQDWWGSFDVRQGQIWVATLNSPSRIYVIENSIPRLMSTLPISVSSFRFESATSLLAVDRNGRLYRFADFLNFPERFETLNDRPSRIVDFVLVP